jgi:hypothetical protein
MMTERGTPSSHSKMGMMCSELKGYKANPAAMLEFLKLLPPARLARGLSLAKDVPRNAYSVRVPRHFRRTPFAKTAVRLTGSAVTTAAPLASCSLLAALRRWIA